KLLRRCKEGCCAGGCEALLDVRARKDFVDIGIHLLDDNRRSARGYEQTEPGVHVEVGVAAFRDSRNIGEAFHTLTAGQCHWAQTLCIDMARYGRQTGEYHIYLPAHQVSQCRGGATVRDMDQLYAGSLVKHFAQQMVDRTVTCRTISQLTTFCGFDQFLDGRELGIRARYDHKGQ